MDASLGVKEQLLDRMFYCLHGNQSIPPTKQSYPQQIANPNQP